MGLLSILTNLHVFNYRFITNLMIETYRKRLEFVYSTFLQSSISHIFYDRLVILTCLSPDLRWREIV